MPGATHVDTHTTKLKETRSQSISVPKRRRGKKGGGAREKEEGPQHTDTTQPHTPATNNKRGFKRKDATQKKEITYRGNEVDDGGKGLLGGRRQQGAL